MLVRIDRNHNIGNTTPEIIERRVETSVLLQRVEIGVKWSRSQSALHHNGETESTAKVSKPVSMNLPDSVPGTFMRLCLIWFLPPLCVCEVI